VAVDLDNLRSKYLPNLGETISLPNRDYPYRAYATKGDVAVAVAAIALDIDYNNFKSEVVHTQGLPREQLYAQVWSVMYNAEGKLGPKQDPFAEYATKFPQKAQRKSKKQA
jgi:hypothetical protein